MTRPVFLLTDFGGRGSYAGQLRAVIARIAPASPIHDITHDVEPFAVEEGAWLLETVVAALPETAVVLAIVDPAVGAARKGIAVSADGRFFVGPDNGLLSSALPAAMRQTGHLSPPVRAHELTSPQYQRRPVSPTFHGRDIFAPAAAHLASGLDLALLGPPLAHLTAFPPFEGIPAARGELHGHIVHIDRFGNLITTLKALQLFPECALEVAGHPVSRRFHTFASAPAGTLFCHADSSGYVAIALNQGSAAAVTGARRGAPVIVRAR